MSILRSLLLALLLFASVDSKEEIVHGIETSTCDIDMTVHETFGNHDAVTALATTEESVWVGTGAALIWLDDSGEETARLTTVDGLSANHITAIEALADDSVYVGTVAGLDYYDGTAWRSLISEDVLDRQLITELAMAGDDLWILTQSRLGLYRDGEFRWVRHQAWERRLLSSIAIDGAGVIWIGMTTGLVKFDMQENAAEVFSVGDGLASNWILDISIRGEELWAATFEGVSYYDGMRWRSFGAMDGLATERTTAIVAAPSIVYVGSDRGVLTFDGVVWEHNPGVGLPPSGRVAALAIGSEKRLLVGAADGLYRYSGVSWQHVPIGSSLPDNAVLDVQSLDGELWVATGRGVGQFDGTTWRHYGVRDGLPGDVAITLAASPLGELWVGMNNGAAVYDGQSWRNIAAIAGTTVRKIDFAADGKVWIATFGDGVASLHDGVASWFVAPDTILSDEVYVLDVAPDGTLWVGTSVGLSTFDGTTWRHIDSSNLAYPVVESISTLSDGSLWLGTRRGLTYFDGENWTSFSENDGLSSDVVLAIQPVPTMTWIGTSHGLSVRGNDGCWRSWTTNDRLPDAQVNDVEVLDNDMWIATQAGVARASYLSRTAGQTAHFPIALSQAR